MARPLDEASKEAMFLRRLLFSEPDMPFQTKTDAPSLLRPRSKEAIVISSKKDKIGATLSNERGTSEKGFGWP